MNCKVTDHNGRKMIDIDGKLFPPLSFKTFRACERNISDFYKAGIKLFSSSLVRRIPEHLKMPLF